MLVKHLLMDQEIDEVQFFGKPFPKVYELLEKTLINTAPNKVIMCGDSLHTDIPVAATRGWQTVLVTRDGLFTGLETLEFCKTSNLFSDWQFPSI